MDGGASIEPVYELSGPIFEKITIKLDQKYYGGKEFVIEAKNASSKNRYIQSARLNDREVNKFWIKHADLVKGGKLVLEMGPEPNKQWASTSEHPQVMDIDPVVTTPYIIETERMFLKESIVKLACDTKGAEIYYTTDGYEPDKQSLLYKESFVVNKTTKVKMKAYVADQSSLPAEAIIEKAVMSNPIFPGEVEPGLSYSYYHGTLRYVNDFQNAIPEKEGVVPNFSIQSREKNEYFAFNFNGFINIPKDGLYTFYIASNDGGQLSIDNSVLVNNDGLHTFTEKYQRVALKAGYHPIAVKYFQEGGGYGLKVSWKGGGIEKQEIPAFVLFQRKK